MHGNSSAITYLDLEAYLGGAFLHPGGRSTTRWLLDVLVQEPDLRRVLEIGCGTGHTARLVADRTGTQVVAMDRSAAMLQTAQACRPADPTLQRGATISDPQWVQADAGRPLPFCDGQFDVIIAELVLALLDPLPVCRECVRILRPGGRLVLNERIWKPGLSAQDVAEVNQASWQAFGIPAATEEPLDWQDWQSLLCHSGLQDVRAIAVDSLLSGPDTAIRARQRLTRVRRYLLRPSMVAYSLGFKARTRQNLSLWARMECYLFLARKPI